MLEKVPGAQFIQVDVEDAPEVSEYVPEKHLRQTLDVADPVEVEYVPSLQFWQLLAASEGENVPAAQFVHAVAPKDDEKDPAAQLIQAAKDVAPKLAK